MPNTPSKLTTLFILGQICFDIVVAVNLITQREWQSEVTEVLERLLQNNYK